MVAPNILKKIFSLFMIRDRFTAMTPIHVAAKSKKAKFIRKISAYPTILNMDARDSTENTAYHYTAKSNKETIEVVTVEAVQDQLTAMPTNYIRNGWREPRKE